MISYQESLQQWTAFAYFEKGLTLLYAGQETGDEKIPSLFERDPVDWSGLNPKFSNFLATLATLKKEPIFRNGNYQVHHTSKAGVILATYQFKQQILYGIFNMEGKTGLLNITCKDGKYLNLVNGKNVGVQDGSLELQTTPVIFYG
jgi:hypothetical protein